MHDALRVRSVKSLRNFDTDAKRLSERQGSSPQARRQGFPLQDSITRKSTPSWWPMS